VRRRLIWVIALLVLLGGGAFGLYWFQPWKLVTDRTVNEAAPTSAASSAATSAGAAPSGTADAPADRVVATGTFISKEHTTTGTVKLTELADGRRVLTLENLDTSNGPDLRVWLTDQPASAGWTAFDDGAWVELGRLKGNKGTQHYEIPAEVKIDSYRSVTIWCKRFSVAFGAAELAAA
jgi:Electron transfer DM13